MELKLVNRFVTIKSPIEVAPKESDFELITEAISLRIEPGSNYIVLKNLYISMDPYQINRMKTYSPSQNSINAATLILPGQAIDGHGVAKVVASGNPDFKKDELVAGMLNWGEYTVAKTAASLTKLDPKGLPLSNYAGVLGGSGLAAYAGFFELCKPKKGEKVFVSAACGSVGNLVGQYAKLVGCYVVGSAGSKEKVALLKDKLGFDDAFNYKEETDLKSTLKRYFPDGIDIYFDNVGGEMLEAAISNMNSFGRVPICGVISEYTNSGRKAVPDMINVIYKRIKIQGYLCSDHMDVHSEFQSITSDYIRNGKMFLLEDISHGVESIPSALIALFTGDNVGKKMVKIFDED